MNEYDALGMFYDQLMTEEDTKERLNYLISLFDTFYGGLPHSLLDLACGTGNLCIEFAKKNLDIVGVDASEEMLSIAADKSKGFTEKILYLKQDMRNLDLNDTVDCAICVMDGMNHLPDLKAVEKVLQRLRLFISSKGLFIFDVNTPWKHKHVLGNSSFVLENENVICVWQNYYNEKKSKVYMDLDFFQEQEDGKYIRFSDSVQERAYTLSTWNRILKANGFAVEAVYADKTTEKPSKQCERWVFVVRNMRDEREYVGE